ncbi:Lrp/AsnC family transcriptional regulator [Bosea sp. 685]|uniref:Lrp/AsnC family transcriptional regulator n=1 Tax=Bosea sp. 685 TaxID=3080057 RepID=UPI002892ACA0|nr:Lrp/AsnC family transcriptional regulator [Bosea sp. 685]WNJ88001.1 Lrp/AsnC family transcriptional regulator [Bosea sp. 685]
MPPSDHDLDAFDRAILSILQVDNSTPQRAIGERVNLSGAAVQRRIRRMERDRVIRGNVAVVEPAALGQSITIFVEVELVSETAADIDAAKAAFTTAPEVQQCYYVTGEVDFVLVVLVPTMEAYETLTRRLFFANPNIRKFKTFVAMDRVKVGLTVAIEMDRQLK